MKVLYTCALPLLALVRAEKPAPPVSLTRSSCDPCDVQCATRGQYDDNLEPFGTSMGDTRLNTCDDCYSPAVQLARPFTFFGREFASLYVSSNGVISFESGVTGFTPTPFEDLSGMTMFSAFWGDGDQEIDGNVWYREENAGDIIIDEIIHDAANSLGSTPAEVTFYENYESTWNFVATWDNVAFFGGYDSDRRNTFQCVLSMDSSGHSMVIYNYGDMEWVTGTASDGDECTGQGGTPAQTGFVDAATGNSFTLAASRTNAMMEIETTSNVDHAGRYIFAVGGETIQGGAGDLGDPFDGPEDLLGECSNSGTDASSLYGCWCQALGDDGASPLMGRPVDDIDEACFRYARCMRCNNCSERNFNAAVNGCDDINCYGDACCQCAADFAATVNGQTMDSNKMNLDSSVCVRTVVAPNCS